MNRISSVTLMHKGYVTGNAGSIICFLPSLAAARVVQQVAAALFPNLAILRSGTQVSILK